MKTQDQAYQKVKKIVDRFTSLSAAQLRKMNESATRQGYILPLFAALGWNVTDINEVSPEEKVSRGWVDFAFRIDGVPRYFLETKRASEDLNDPRWVQQAIDYAWTKSVTWALLSDFEGLKVFNAEWKADNPFRAQFLEFNLETYVSDFERLWWLSRPETAAGRLGAEAEKVGKKLKREPVSQTLFDDLKQWRIGLFKDMRGFNPMWTPAQVDEAVLRLLNRLVFIRTAEDRQVEAPRLLALVRTLKDQKRFDDLWKELAKLFQEMDSVYNSELFVRHFSEELYVTPVILEKVIEGLYEKNFIRYNFNALDADVLGTVYEQYLGSVVAEVKDAPSSGQLQLIEQTSLSMRQRRKKRKSQGIYYTPTFVTKYIVKRTVDHWLEEHGYNPSQPPHVLDMACGSGSFLIEAFDTIDTFVARQRGQAHGEQIDIFDYTRQVEVLTNCIFGVDKDKQAVEVARLNLLLRALHSRERLPMLENIYHGDSLLPETWEQAFPKITKAGGFDVIIGNPPYVRQETLGKKFKEFAKCQFETYTSTADLCIYFIEQAHKLLKPDGLFGMIVSNKWMRANYGKALRKYLKRESTLVEIIDFGELPVFQDAATFPAIIITRKEKTEKHKFLYAPIKRLEFPSLSEEAQSVGSMLDERALEGENWMLTDIKEQKIFEKMHKNSISVGEYTGKQVYFGVKTGFNKAFVINQRIRDQIIFEDEKSATHIKPFVVGDDVRKFHIHFDRQYVIRIPKGWTQANMSKADDAWIWFEENYPALAKHLIKYKESAQMRQDQGDYWWELRACDYYGEFEKPKIVYPDIAKESRAAFDADGLYFSNTVYFIPLDDLYLLGLLNSKLIFTYFKRIASVLGDPDKGGRLRWFRQDVMKIPVRRLNLTNLEEKASHDGIVVLVEQILSLQKELAALNPAEHFDEIRALDRHIVKVDVEIDRRVYELYGLTEEEISTVEGR